MNPARMFLESLDRRPGIREQPGVLVVQKRSQWVSISKARGAWPQAAIAAISGLIPMIFITRVRL